MKIVSDRLGHSTTTITTDLYSHVTPVVAHAAAEAIAELVARNGEDRDQNENEEQERRDVGEM